MKIKSVQTGEVIEVSDEAGEHLIKAGIYTRVEKAKPQSPTAVQPMTTNDMPSEATPATKRRPKK